MNIRDDENFLELWNFFDGVEIFFEDMLHEELVAEDGRDDVVEKPGSAPGKPGGGLAGQMKKILLKLIIKHRSLL
jgi:hypothetical protein